MSESINDGGPAFPVPDSHHANGQVQYGANGMTLRDWFAGQALSGITVNPDTNLYTERDQARWCYEIADSMLAMRKRKESAT